MSWSETARSGIGRLGRIGTLLTLALGLGGCLQPMYAQNGGPVVASTGPGGPTIVAGGPQAALASIDILPVDGRIGLKIRNDLIFALSGGAGAPTAPRYRLDMTVQVITAQVAIVDPFTSRPQLQTAGVDVAYALVEIGKGIPILSGNAFGRATYTRNRQRFASTRAQRDAEDRAAKVTVEQIRAKLMGHFSGLHVPVPVTSRPPSRAVQDPFPVKPASF
jgi:LPS-assembly lipoprotein